MMFSATQGEIHFDPEHPPFFYGSFCRVPEAYFSNFPFLKVNEKRYKKSPGFGL